MCTHAISKNEENHSSKYEKIQKSFRKKMDKLKYVKTKWSGMVNKRKSPTNLMEKTDNKFEQIV